MGYGTKKNAPLVTVDNKDLLQEIADLKEQASNSIVIGNTPPEGKPWIDTSGDN
ncbi:hypothetical protein [Bacillus sp. AG4(2022)]|uniref:hypothetical protein n=1 Tax=Bacillus sp. AG4(2022) TaxID=2962594 RepID=UPI002880DC4F|nr:hypothetical protein [Bacillus sp. AG4(2022)]MDT0160271.1 hypothetical protein [Bacillus sp. AG4(2022)]